VLVPGSESFINKEDENPPYAVFLFHLMNIKDIIFNTNIK
jgi:hypothetical protein